MKAEQEKINWWNVNVGEHAAPDIASAIAKGHISQGPITAEFERALAKFLGVPYTVCTTSGTMALSLSMLALGVGPGDEVIMPDRTWVASANAAMLLGAKVRLVDVLDQGLPIMDTAKIAEAITPATKVIMPVHLNGRGVDMEAVLNIAKKHGLQVVEDACPSLGSLHKGRAVGTFGRFGCFSLGMAKVLGTGQGGVVVCHNESDFNLLSRIRNQGLSGTSMDERHDIRGSNFKFTDIQAALGLAQIPSLEKRYDQQKKIHAIYAENLQKTSSIQFIPVDIAGGEIPLRAEGYCQERDRFVVEMEKRGVAVSPQSLNLSSYPFIGADKNRYPNAQRYSQTMLTLPSGPDQPLANVERTVEIIHSIDHLF
ncbi:MAG: DegT/DnrJ/EryC1/StrS family aminotransferase [Magnetococcales bacterium]|nr:DegT/DnrJ/EryC1/StrS family aminotransferase [Magnetococcales bacterium]